MTNIVSLFMRNDGCGLMLHNIGGTWPIPCIKLFFFHSFSMIVAVLSYYYYFLLPFSILERGLGSLLGFMVGGALRTS